MKKISNEMFEILIELLYKNKKEEEKPFQINENDKMFSMSFKRVINNNYEYGKIIHTTHSYNKNDIIKIMYKDFKKLSEK